MFGFFLKTRTFVTVLLLVTFLWNCSGKHTVEVPEYKDSSVSSRLCERFVCSNIIDAGPDMGMDLRVDSSLDQGLDKPMPDLPSPDIADPDGLVVDLAIPDEGVIPPDTLEPDSEPQGCVWSLEIQGLDEAFVEPNGLESYADPQPNTMTFVFENTGDTYYCKVLAVPGDSAIGKIEISLGEVTVLPGDEQIIEVTFVEGGFEGATFEKHELPIDFFIDEKKETTRHVKVTVYNPGTFFFTKDSDQPVMSGTVGEWDEGNVLVGDIIKKDGVYKMWYVGGSPGAIGFGVATSDDGTTWVKYAQNPVMVPEDPWEINLIFAPSVVHDGSTYHMFYIGSADDKEETRIGYASSSDGLIWEKSSNNPIIEPDPQNNETEVGPISVVFDNGIFKAWHIVEKQDPITSEVEYAFQYATSSDGQTWNNDGSGSMYAQFGKIVRVAHFDVIKDNLGYRMFFTAHTWEDELGEGLSQGIYVLVSEDGITWSNLKEVSVLDSIAPVQWERSLLTLSVIREDAFTLRLWYTGGFSTEGWSDFKIGTATAHAPGFLDFQVSLDPSVICDSSADSDCKGTLVVGAGNGKTLPYMQMGAVHIDGSADLTGNKTIQGTLNYVPAGTVQASAYLVDKATGTIYRTEGDLKETTVKSLTIQSNQTVSESFTLSRLSKGSDTVFGYVEVDTSNPNLCHANQDQDCEGLLTVYALLETGGNMYSVYRTSVDLLAGNAYFELYDLPQGVPIQLCAFLKDNPGEYENFIEGGDVSLFDADCPIVTLPDPTEQLITLDKAVY